MTARLPVRGETTRRLLFPGALVIGLAPLGGSPPPGETPTGVLLITLDTTRADRLTPYGFMDAVMPGVERLAREGVLFQQAASVAPLTLPAHTSIMTGLLPPRHDVRDNIDGPLAPPGRTLAELLSSKGFRTAAFVGSAILGADRGLSQGFEHYGDVPPNDRAGEERRQRRADEVVRDALQWLDAIDGSRFFLLPACSTHGPVAPAPLPCQTRGVADS